MEFIIKLIDKGLEAISVFGFVFSILYVLKVVYEIAKVYTLREGQVTLGKHGLLYLACAISFILTFILV